MIDRDRTEEERERDRQRHMDEILCVLQIPYTNVQQVQHLIDLCEKSGVSISKSTLFCALAPSKSRYTKRFCSPAFRHNPRIRLCSFSILCFPLFFLFLPSSHYLQTSLSSSSSSFSPVSFPLQTHTTHSKLNLKKKKKMKVRKEHLAVIILETNLKLYLNTSKSARWVCWSDESGKKGWIFAWRKQRRGEWLREAWQR